jgi:hypothetical protein
MTPDLRLIIELTAYAAFRSESPFWSTPEQEMPAHQVSGWSGFRNVIDTHFLQ